MKKLIIFILIAAAGYYSWQKYSDQSSNLESLYEYPYVVVYGKEGCGWTQDYVNKVQGHGLNYVYKSVTEKEVADELHPRMKQAGLLTNRYLLPVIDVNANMYIRPEMEIVIEKYNMSSEL